MTFAEIEVELVKEGIIDYDNISSKTIERKLNEMVNSMEIVNFKKRGRVKEFYISDDILKDLEDEEVLKLYYISRLYRNIIVPNVSGYYFFDTLKDYMQFERKLEIEEKDCFQYKNLHFHPVIEEEIILKIMKAIENRNEIILINNDKGMKSQKYDTEVLKPFKLRYDIECGRFYLFSFTNKGRCISSRLDRNDGVKILSTKFNYEKYEEKYKYIMEKSFSSVPHNSDDPYDEVEFNVKIDSLKQYYIIEKITGELGECKLEKISDNEYIIKKEVNDSWEMIPWIRKYGGFLKVVSPKWLSKKIKEDWEEMLKNYGAIS